MPDAHHLVERVGHFSPGHGAVDVAVEPARIPAQIDPIGRERPELRDPDSLLVAHLEEIRLADGSEPPAGEPHQHHAGEDRVGVEDATHRMIVEDLLDHRARALLDPAHDLELDSHHPLGDRSGAHRDP